MPFGTVKLVGPVRTVGLLAKQVEPIRPFGPIRPVRPFGPVNSVGLVRLFGPVRPPKTVVTVRPIWASQVSWDTKAFWAIFCELKFVTLW